MNTQNDIEGTCLFCMRTAEHRVVKPLVHWSHGGRGYFMVPKLVFWDWPNGFTYKVLALQAGRPMFGSPEPAGGKKGLVAHACSPSTGEAIRKFPETYWWTSVANFQSQGSVWHCLNNIKNNWGRHPMLTSSLHMHEHVYIYTWYTS